MILTPLKMTSFSLLLAFSLLIFSLNPCWENRPSSPDSAEYPNALGTRDDPPIGNSTYFWILKDSNWEEVLAYLVASSSRSLIYMESGLNYSKGELAFLVDSFDNSTYPRLTGVFGPEPRPPDDIDGDPRITILINMFSSAFIADNELPRNEIPYSNEREMIYVEYNPYIGAVAKMMAHEFCHLVVWNGDPNEVRWVNEGLAGYAQFVAGYGIGTLSDFESAPHVSLTEWDENVEETRAQYGASALFFHYLAQHHGGNETILELVKNPSVGIAGISDTLALAGIDANFKSVFENWTLANYLNDESAAGGRFWYRNVSYFGFEPSAVPMISDLPYRFHQARNITNWATHYFVVSWSQNDISGGDLRIDIREVRGEGLHVSLIQFASETMVSQVSVDQDGTASLIVRNFGVDVTEAVLLVSSQPSNGSIDSAYDLSVAMAPGPGAHDASSVVLLALVCLALLTGLSIIAFSMRRQRLKQGDSDDHPPKHGK